MKRLGCLGFRPCLLGLLDCSESSSSYPHHPFWHVLAHGKELLSVWSPYRPHRSIPMDFHPILPKDELVLDALKRDVQVVLDLAVAIPPPFDLSCMPMPDARSGLGDIAHLLASKLSDVLQAV